MDNTIQFPDGYRYDSDIHLFKQAVDCAKKMLEDGKAIISYQFIDVISVKVFMTQDEFEREYTGISWQNFINILNSEIIYLLRHNFEESIGNDSELKNYLEENKVPEEYQEKIIKLKLDKRIYVGENLGGEKERNRYYFKNRSFFDKISDIDYEVSRTIDKEEILYATIRMSVNSTLESKDMPRAVSNVFNQNKKDITFICDKSDIEYLIHKLERIKQML